MILLFGVERKYIPATRCLNLIVLAESSPIQVDEVIKLMGHTDRSWPVENIQSISGKETDKYNTDRQHVSGDMNLFQTTTVRGRLSKQATQFSNISCTVHLTGHSANAGSTRFIHLVTSPDSSGSFRFKNVPAGIYLLNVFDIGLLFDAYIIEVSSSTTHAPQKISNEPGSGVNSSGYPDSDTKRNAITSETISTDNTVLQINAFRRVSMPHQQSSIMKDDFKSLKAMQNNNLSPVSYPVMIFHSHDYSYSKQPNFYFSWKILKNPTAILTLIFIFIMIFTPLMEVHSKAELEQQYINDAKDPENTEVPPFLQHIVAQSIKA